MYVKLTKMWYFNCGLDSVWYDIDRYIKNIYMEGSGWNIPISVLCK